MKKQTAVEYLIKGLSEGLDINFNWRTKHIIEQAKEMEKQQIIEAHGNKEKKSGGVSNYTYTFTGEEYYNGQFKK
jgi:hypothetical protein